MSEYAEHSEFFTEIQNMFEHLPQGTMHQEKIPSLWRCYWAELMHKARHKKDKDDLLNCNWGFLFTEKEKLLNQKEWLESKMHLKDICEITETGQD